MNGGFGVYQKLVNEWAKKNDMSFVLPEFLDLFKQIEKQSAIASEIKVLKEFKFLLTKLELDYSFGNDSGFKYPKYLLDKRIEIKKRLKELESKGVN